MKKLVNYFFQGILYIAPIGITGYIIYLIFSFIDNLVNKTFQKLFDIDIPGLGILVMALLLVITGIMGQSIIAKPFKFIFKSLLDKVPLLKVIYSAFNDLFSAFVGKGKKFNRPVLVLVNPISNLEKIGFLTEEDLTKLNEKEKVAVYFPHSYNFSGELFIVPRSQIKTIDISPTEAMKFIISGGVSGFSDQEQES